MASLLSTAHAQQAASALSADQLALLAETYDDVATPVWICDLWNRCVYRNRSAERLGSKARPRMQFEIVDHEARVVGHLATCEN